jgi:pSer/pThr/pTyr-binding forkhead associated (FHA) protein
VKSEQVTGQSKSGFFVTIGTAAGSTTKRVDGDLLTVGRAEDCHLTISHETLSRRHMTVSLKDGACWVEDHASANGTFVNGKRIRPHSLIRVLPEDQITMGQAGVRISVSAEPVMRKEGAPPIPREVDEQTQSQINDTIVTSTSLVRREQRQLAPVGQPKAKDEAQEQAERQLQEAQKTAAKMIQ